PGEPWMGDAIVRMRDDPAVAAAASVAEGTRDSIAGPPFAALARTLDGSVLATAARVRIEGRDVVGVFMLHHDAGSLFTTALAVAAARALGDQMPGTELDTTTIPDAQLGAWQRTASASVSGQSPSGESDGRWLWIAALAMLALETWLRRAPA